MDIAEAREAARQARGSARNWLRGKPAHVRGDREAVLALVQRDGFALEHATEKMRADREIVLQAVETGAFAFNYAAPELRADRSFVLAAMQRNGFALACVPEHLQADREVVLAAVREDGGALEYAADKLKADPEVAATAAKRSDSAFEHIPRCLWADRAFVRTVTGCNAAAVSHASKELQQDHEFLFELIEGNGLVLQHLGLHRDFMLAAVQRSVAAFEYVPAQLRRDAGFVLDAARFHPGTLERLPAVLWEDRGFALSALELSPAALQHAPAFLRADEQLLLAAAEGHAAVLGHAEARLLADRCFMLDAVDRNAAALAQVAPSLREDCWFNLAAVRRNSQALRHVSAHLWANCDFVLSVVGLDPGAFAHASPELRSDRDFVLRVVQQQGLALWHAEAGLRADREVVEAAVQRDADALAAASPALRADRAAVLACVRRNGHALRHAITEFRGAPDVALAAVRQDASALQYASEGLRGDRGFMLEAVELDGAALQHAAPALRADRGFALQAVERQAHAVQYVDEALLRDRTFHLKAAHRNPRSLSFAPAEFRSSRDFVLAVVRINGRSLRFASTSLHTDQQLINAAKASDSLGSAVGNSGPPAPPSEEALEARGIPVLRLGSIQASADLAEQWDRLERLCDRGLQEDCALLGLLPKVCMESYGMEGLIDHLKVVAMWHALTLRELQLDCAELGLHHGTSQPNVGARVAVARDFFTINNVKLKQGCHGVVVKVDKIGDMYIEFAELTARGGCDTKLWVRKDDLGKLEVEADETLRRQLIERLVDDLFSDVSKKSCTSHEQKRLPVKQLGSISAASVVLRRWEKLRSMSATELVEEFRGLLGIRPQHGTQRSELEAQLLDAAAWAEMPVAGLRDACEQRSLSGRVHEDAPELAQRLQLLERLHQSLCAPQYLAKGVDLTAVGSIAAGSRLLAEHERIQTLGRTGLEEECSRLGMPAQSRQSSAELQRRLRKVALWNALPFELLFAECRLTGLRSAGHRSHEEAGDARGRLVRELIAAQFTEVPLPEDRGQRQRHEFRPRVRREPESLRKHRQVLELPPDASVADVRRAYRRLALRHHPDKNARQAKDASSERFREVVEAYKALLDHFGQQG